MTWALGMDPSLSHTALVLGHGDPGQKKQVALQSFKIKVELKKFPHEIARLGALVERFLSVLEVCEEEIPRDVPRVLCLENYSFGSVGRNAQLGEWGGQIRLHAWSRGWTTIAIPPTTLKKFVTGSGKSEKDMLMMHVLQRWKYESTDNNNADAYALMRVGLLFASHLQGEHVTQETLDLFKKCVVYTPYGATG